MKPPPFPLLSLVLTSTFLIFVITPAECKKVKQQHTSKHAKLEPDWYDDEEEDFFEDDAMDEKWREHGVKMSESQFAAWWPPTKTDGTSFEKSPKGLKEWEKYRDEQIEEYKKYHKNLTDTLEKLGMSDSALGLGNMARRYPFCVDGYLPIMDRKKFNADKLDQNTLTTVDLTLEDTKDAKVNDDDLTAFQNFFLDSQSQNVVVATSLGTPIIEHIENGKNDGSYVTSIAFTKIISPPPPLGIQFNGADGSVELPFWLHIIIKARVPLEGLYVQAIGFPMGLPFGQFRDDFDCDAGSFSDLKKSVDKYNPDGKIPLSQNPSRRNIIVPCKYSHGNNNGDMHPNVYAYGGRKLPEGTKPITQTEFRMHFNWASVHCNLKTRVQFLIMAVRSFKRKDFEVFFSANYILTQQNAAGSPPPYIPGSKDDFGWDGSMMCDKLVSNSKDANHDELALIHDATTSGFPIPYDGQYDRCINNDETLDNFFADNAAFMKETLETAKTESFNEPQLTPENTERYINNLILIRKAQMICPPADLCLNSEGKDIQYDENGHPVNPEKDIRADFDGIKSNNFPTCQITFCRNPNETEPILVQVKLDVNDLDENTPALVDGGTRFDEEFTKGFYRNATRHFRRIKGTHLWSMTLAWFVLMTIGAFTARYYKETAGINDKTENSVLGLGYWIWVHIFLLLLSLTFMWIGILETARFRQKPVSCNALKFGEFSLKNYCRWRKRTVRYHRKAGIAAVVFYHIALAISWSRPVKLLPLPFTKYKFPIRKFFLWVHVVFAYLGKVVCFVSIMMFFNPKAKSICKSIPVTVIFMEFVSIVFFAAGWVVQCMEDKRIRRNGRRVFPVPEAIESADHSPCYMMKIIVVLVSIVVHLILFIFICVLSVFVYGKPGEGTLQSATFEQINGIIGTCNISSSETELTSSMKIYYYNKRGDASDG